MCREGRPCVLGALLRRLRVTLEAHEREHQNLVEELIREASNLDSSCFCGSPSLAVLALREWRLLMTVPRLQRARQRPVRLLWRYLLQNQLFFGAAEGEFANQAARTRPRGLNVAMARRTWLVCAPLLLAVRPHGVFAPYS
jgi:hypothetical protein